MKFGKKMLVGVCFVAALMFVPHTSKANILTDLINWIEGLSKPKDKKPSKGNSVPLNTGLVVLTLAGLGLGTKMILDHNKKSKTAKVLA